jgi:transposase
MPRKTTNAEAVATIGIDIGKNTFHLIGLDRKGAIVLRQKLSRGQVEGRLANMPPCLIGMEACVGAHHLSRQLKAHGHDARLMPARYVRPYSRGQKNDFRDAEAIAEAVLRPTMKFVAIKTVEQLDLQALHRVRERLVCQRTSALRHHPVRHQRRRWPRQHRRLRLLLHRRLRHGSGRPVGPAYASRLIEFASSSWRPEVAAQRADSLRRTIDCLRRLARPA